MVVPSGAVYDLECKLESAKWYGDEGALFVEVVAASADAEAFSAEDWLMDRSG